PPPDGPSSPRLRPLSTRFWRGEGWPKAGVRSQHHAYHLHPHQTQRPTLPGRCPPRQPPLPLPPPPPSPHPRPRPQQRRRPPPPESDHLLRRYPSRPAEEESSPEGSASVETGDPPPEEPDAAPTPAPLPTLQVTSLRAYHAGHSLLSLPGQAGSTPPPSPVET